MLLSVPNPWGYVMNPILAVACLAAGALFAALSLAAVQAPSAKAINTAASSPSRGS